MIDRVARSAAMVLVVGVLGCRDDSVAVTPDGASSVPPARARNLLLISVDALRADRVGCYGGRAEASPSVDWLGSEGVRFAECHAPMGMTLPCVTSLFTSRYPDETGVVHNQAIVSDEEFTLAERLKDAGFRTRGFVANGVLRADASGIDQGFDSLERIYGEYKMTTLAIEHLNEGFGADDREFLWVHYMDPHQPYDRREPFATDFDPDYDGAVDAEAETLDRIFVEKEALADRDLSHILAVYDSQVRFISMQIGRLLSALEMSGAAEETLIVFTADHGEELYAHNRYFYHANSVYGAVTHVPLIFKQTGAVPAGVVVDSLTELVDVMPTILAHLGIDPTAGDALTRPRGIDLHGAFDGGAVRKEFAVAQVAREVYGLRTARWFLVENPNDFMPRSVPEEGEYPIGALQLFDLERDRAERENVADAHADVVKKMRARLASWRASLATSATAKQDLTPEELQELEQLGYLGEK